MLLIAPMLGQLQHPSLEYSTGEHYSISFGGGLPMVSIEHGNS